MLRAAAGDRFPSLEISAFATFVVTDNRRARTEELIRQRGWMLARLGSPRRRYREMPTIFIGSHGTGLYRMNAPFMRLERHERGIHVV